MKNTFAEITQNGDLLVFVKEYGMSIDSVHIPFDTLREIYHEALRFKEAQQNFSQNVTFKHGRCDDEISS